MLTTSKILKSISPHTSKDTAIGSFLEWLPFNCESEEMVTPELLTSFFQECLDYPHWCQNKKQLGDEIRYFFEALCTHHDEIFSFDEVIWPLDFQVIEIENTNTWNQVLHTYLSSHYKANEKFKIILDGAEENPSQQRMIAIILRPQGLLSVRQFNRKFFIRNGGLCPLREDLELQYDDELNLVRECSQKIEIGAYSTAKFKLEDQGLFGSAVRGYLFQKYQSFSGNSLDQSPRLFYAIKRLEQHFLKRESDPFYQETVEALEHGIRMLRLNDDHTVLTAPDLLSQAQNALEYVFIGDKLLGLLIRDLQYTMAGKTSAPVLGVGPSAITSTAVKQKEENIWSHQNVSLKQAPIPVQKENHQIVQKNVQRRTLNQEHLVFHPQIESDLIN